MRRFVILGHRVTISPDFNLNDLAGSAGRLDILCRCLSSAFFLSHDLRRDVEVYLILQDQVVLRMVGSQLHRMNPDERNIAGLIRSALGKLEERERMSTPGIFVAPGSLKTVVDQLAEQETQLILLHEAGAPLRDSTLSNDVTFFLSDHLEFTASEQHILREIPRISVSPLPLHANHCITIVHNELDLRDISEHRIFDTTVKARANEQR
ncbi:tRNA (pseudouridine(54)-N(1))-methyltransferase TrmY [Candidatus Acetothermia bacterium]|jgi:tRNA (pseudouridine54-N1)-methyltransferase|nr:tRNA (pseudouridine(54)-N(1))-methyltransferase TrmY [Candidatus Acetothermia bacterium]